VVAPIAFLAFPRWLGIPFGKIELREYLKRIGFYLPGGAWKHIILGLVLAACTLSGMLMASVLMGRYAVDTSTINVPHLVFSLNPGLWEEFFYRGVLMLLLLKLTQSLRRASVIQIVLFGLMHIKGLDVWGLVDVITVMVIAAGFTFVAYKTRSLVAGIVFHYFHDALLFFVQPPEGVGSGLADNVMFHAFLWLMVGIACVITRLAAEKLGVRAPEELYTLDST
jgi:membrane protease YdiL (CAAX protease family)